MSITGISVTTEDMSKKMFHWRNNSGELDVFEATNYFSAATEHNNNNNPNLVHNKQAKRVGRMSLDMPMMNNSSILIPTQTQYVLEKPLKNDQKKHKQPSSPGGKLASFLNSLFNQTSSKKKLKSIKDQEDHETQIARRKRRSSISHFNFKSSSISTTTTTDSKSMNSSLSSGFRTPPSSYTQNPTKPRKDFRSFTDQEVSHEVYADMRTTHNNNPAKPDIDFGSFTDQEVSHEVYVDMRKTENSWLDEKVVKLNRGVSDKCKNRTNGFSDKKKNSNWDVNVDHEDDDGADSDSSSDLFDLPNTDLDLCFSSSGLPVYETTKLDNIKKVAQISRSKN